MSVGCQIHGMKIDIPVCRDCYEDLRIKFEDLQRQLDAEQTKSARLQNELTILAGVNQARAIGRVEDIPMGLPAAKPDAALARCEGERDTYREILNKVLPAKTMALPVYEPSQRITLHDAHAAMLAREIKET